MYSYDTNWIYNIVLLKEKSMKAYIDLLKHILENGDRKEDRTNTGTISSFGHQLSFDLSKVFLLLPLNHWHGKEWFQNYSGF